MKKYLNKKAPDIIKEISHFLPMIIIIAFTVVSSLLHTNIDISKASNNTQTTLEYFQTFFYIIFLIHPMYIIFNTFFIGRNKINLYHIFANFFTLLLSFYILYFIIFLYNDSLISLFKENERINYQSLSIFTLIWFYLFCSDWFFKKMRSTVLLGDENNHHNPKNLMLKKSSLKSNHQTLLSKNKLESVIVHELGHLIMLGIFKEKLNNVELIINYRHKAGEPYGMVKYEMKNDSDFTISNFYKKMMVTLSGKKAEEIFLGREMLGSTSDNNHWYQMANTYLLEIGGHDIVYYPIPFTKAHIKSNNNTIKELKKQQSKKIEFILSNHDNMIIFNKIKEIVYGELELSERVVIKNDKIAHLLNQINYSFNKYEQK